MYVALLKHIPLPKATHRSHNENKLYQINNLTDKYFYDISYLSFLFGMPNFWVGDLKMARAFVVVYRYFHKLCNMAIYVLILLELGAFKTQNNLTQKQETDRWIYNISHPMLLSCTVIVSRQETQIKDLLVRVLGLKEVYNDKAVEARMVKKSVRTLSILVLSCALSMLLNSVSAFLQVIRSDGTYTTVITAWPQVDDCSNLAGLVRVITNITWWLFLNRVYGSYIVVISLTTTMSFQFSQLQSYFYSLEGIFANTNLTQRERESKYEQALKTGIKLHSDTIQCVNLTKNICGGVYSGQIVFVIAMLVFLMLQMVWSERTMMNAFATACTATAVLISSGFFLWSAGDITIEASNLGTAMYSSGWHNCRGNSRRIRMLLIIAMTRAQKPVVLKGLGIMDLSYQSYLKLVKSSYSVFSVIY